MQLTFRSAKLNDLDRIMEIEQSGFSPEEAATRKAMKERIQVIPDSFIVATDPRNKLLGYVVGPVINERCLYDDLFKKTVLNPQTGGYQSILSLAVAPEYYRHGIAGKLLKKLSEEAKDHKRKGITLTCLEELIPFYEKNGYKIEGISSSQHAGETWYDMILDF
ncbi:GNAT family N-acetyltransferase [Enterococcus sp. BWT-B8]|uniref:GNAT family N-acetyltransferase n=1 Tax=Enterococcus sp. BWT-B8 TaxID=2885157 RepID=UPI001E35CFD3|nr:N-acetyltransferase [Enterococcus sp. BWT-B8]MCB5950673.1 GNAT family N-acetyltransferase [Enterococcus sp. BWT-B8]